MRIRAAHIYPSSADFDGFGEVELEPVRDRKTVMSEGVAAAAVQGATNKKQRPRKILDSGVLSRRMIWSSEDFGVYESSRNQVSTVGISFQ